MRLRCQFGVVLLLLAMAGLSASPRARGCAVAPPKNKQVLMANESALIIWDAASKTQHFIRRATFDATTGDFGFLVPTPTKPTLEEADDELFSTLARITEPKVVTKPRPSSFGCGCGGAPAGRALKAPGSVRVLDEKRVAGHDAVVLEADKADDLSKWLKEHGYEFAPALTEWVKPYVEKGWKITAFRIATDLGDKKHVGTSAVRMTFKTDQPFYPYREPAEPKDAKRDPREVRVLRVFFAAKDRVTGTLGEKEKAWPAVTAWSNQLEEGQREKLLELAKLPAETSPATWWLTEFEDLSMPRPGEADVYFSSSEDQAPVEREPVVHYVSRSVPDCIMCYALAAYLFLPCLVRHLRRNRAGS
jgi:hypothetical protein